MVAIIFFKKTFYQLCSDRLFWANLFSSPIVFGHPWSMESMLILPKALQAGHGWLCLKVEWKKLHAISIVGREKMESNKVGNWLAGTFLKDLNKRSILEVTISWIFHLRKQVFFFFFRMEDGLLFLPLLLKIGWRLKEVEIWCLFNKYRNIYTYTYILDI